MKKSYFSKIKNWGKYGLLSMALLFSVSSALADLSDGLIVHYTFDGAVGGIVEDKSGNLNDGALVGAAVILQGEGKTGDALHLGPQASPAVDYVQLADNISTELENFSVAAWVKLDDLDLYWARLFDFGSGTANNMFIAPRAGGSNAIRFAIKRNNGAEQQINGSDIRSKIGQWMHVAVSVDYTQSTGKLYVDGTPVGENRAITIMPKDMMGEMVQNYIGAGQYGDAGLNGSVDDFRVYNRALSDSEILELAGGDPATLEAYTELIGAYDAFIAMGDEAILGRNNSFLDIWSDLTLMSKITGFDNVILTWTSSNESVIATDGKRTSPTGNTPVELKVTFSHPVIPELSKEQTYTLLVTTDDQVPAEIAIFTFESPVFQDGKIKVVSSADNPVKYAGTFENGVKVRTIGTGGDQYKVLDVGDTNGYFDMGREIGEAFCQLTDYTMSCYYLVEDDASIAGAGHFLWSFSNSDNVGTDRNGCVFTQPWNSTYAITRTQYSAEQRVVNANHFSSEPDYKGKWHHLLYSQIGNTGTLYVDGVSVAQNTNVTIWPVFLKLADRSGTWYNYLGRSPYNGDNYMNNTLLHDFRIYSYGFDEFAVDLSGIATKLVDLDLAYQNNDGRVQENTALIAAYNALTLNVPARITENLNFPESIEGHPGIIIAWTTSNEAILDNKGSVIRQKFYDYPVETITANLIDINTGETLSKVFEVNSVVPMLDGTGITTNELIVHYDFSQVDDRTVTDKASLQLKGTLMNEAGVVTLSTEAGETTNVLELGNGTGYFDMGTEIGQIMYNVGDYTIGAYVYIDEDYEEISRAGNFLWTFANGVGVDGGYIVSILNAMRIEVRKTSNESLFTYLNEEGGNMGKAAERGKWFHFAYSHETLMLEGEESGIGTIYVDGEYMNTGVISNNPAAALSMPNKIGTPFNWIGRSNYTADAYLRQSYVADFRIYGVTLDGDGLKNKLDMAATLEKLNNSSPNSIKSNKVDASYSVFVRDGQLEIAGLQGGENISLFDIVGRKYSVNSKLPSGIYIVKVNNFTTKVWVK